MFGNTLTVRRFLSSAAPLALLALYGLFGPTLASAAERVVGKPNTSCPGAQYNTITAAINAASAGDTILVCPALYDEQLVITKPLELRGIQVAGYGRVLIQPSTFQPPANASFVAVITVMNTQGVTISNLALDASKNNVSGCTPSLAVVHFHDAAGQVLNNAISGGQLTNPTGCSSNLPFGNGFGVQADSDRTGRFPITVSGNSIHDYTANGILIETASVGALIKGNSVSGVGPSSGTFQFGIFLANGSVGHVTENVITEGGCGTLAPPDCISVRSEGITLRAVGDGTEIDHNLISHAQSGIFINGAKNLWVHDNIISNIEAMSGMDIQGTASQGLTESLIDANYISHVGPIDSNASNDEEGCGINEYSQTGVSGNKIANNVVNDAYCGVAAVAADRAVNNRYWNTLYKQLNSDAYPSTFPPATEP